MRVIIAGSRTITDYELVKRMIESAGLPISCVISGGAKGVDLLGEQWAKERGIPVEVHKPDWSVGKQAGMLRNEEMAKVAQGLIVIWDGNSKGTQHMLRIGLEQKLDVTLYRQGFTGLGEF